MTLEQATVAIKHGLPVVLVNNKISDDSEGKTYKICAITKCIRKYEKNFSYSATISRNNRAEYSVGLYDIELHPEFAAAYNVFIEELHRQSLKYYIAILLNEGGNKTTITKLVKELIDQIRKDK